MNIQYNIILHSYELLSNTVYHDNDDEGRWHILFADVVVINITFQVIFTYDIFFGVIHKALIRMGVNFLHGNLWKKVFLK